MLLNREVRIVGYVSATRWHSRIELENVVASHRIGSSMSNRLISHDFFESEFAHAEASNALFVGTAQTTLSTSTDCENSNSRSVELQEQADSSS